MNLDFTIKSLWLKLLLPNKDVYGTHSLSSYIVPWFIALEKLVLECALEETKIPQLCILKRKEKEKQCKEVWSCFFKRSYIRGPPLGLLRVTRQSRIDFSKGTTQNIISFAWMKPHLAFQSHTLEPVSPNPQSNTAFSQKQKLKQTLLDLRRLIKPLVVFSHTS